MATSYKQRLLRIQRDYERRLDQELGEVAQQIGQRVMATAIPVAEGERVVPNQRGVRERLRRDIWEQVLKPYFIGRGNEALEGARPQSPYARLIVEGVEAVLRLEVERQVSIIKKYAGRDPEVWEWLTAPGRARPAGEMKSSSKIISEQDRRPWYDPFHLFVYENSPYRLSDRVWNTAIEVRARVDGLLDYHIPRGTAAVDIADLLVPFLNPSQRGITTNRPYGTVGSYAARRLARTEITAAAGRSLINAALVNPYIEGIRWALSPSHPKTDRCDVNAAGGDNGDGIYVVRNVPIYPDHPHCLCTLIPVVMRDPAAVTADLRRQIEEAQTGRSGGAARPIDELRGVFNSEWLFQALFYGWIGDVIERIRA